MPPTRSATGSDACASTAANSLQIRPRPPVKPAALNPPANVVTVEAPSRLPIELDGEQPGTTPVRFELVPRALRIRVPK